MENQTKVIIGLGVLLLIAIGYIAVDRFQEQKQKDLVIAYQDGMNEGVQQIVTGLMEQGQLCSQIPVTIGNKTITLIAVECLRQG